MPNTANKSGKTARALAAEGQHALVVATLAEAEATQMMLAATAGEDSVSSSSTSSADLNTTKQQWVAAEPAAQAPAFSLGFDDEEEVEEGQVSCGRCEA